MRYISLIGIFLFLSGCGHSSHYSGGKAQDNIGFNLTGQPISRLIEIYGPPYATVPLSANETGYTWYGTSSEPASSYLTEQARPKDYQADSLGGKAVDIITGNFRPVFIDRHCKFDVFARDGIVTKAGVADSDNPQACQGFYQKWHDDNLKHPGLSAR